MFFQLNWDLHLFKANERLHYVIPLENVFLFQGIETQTRLDGSIISSGFRLKEAMLHYFILFYDGYKQCYIDNSVPFETRMGKYRNCSVSVWMTCLSRQHRTGSIISNTRFHRGGIV
jgi:hypothetical protein